ncbi:hypothetical protein Tco_0198503, partial [Tanacetum coccineum]
NAGDSKLMLLGITYCCWLHKLTTAGDGEVNDVRHKLTTAGDG